MTSIIDIVLPLALAAYCIYRVQKKPNMWLNVLSVILVLGAFNNAYMTYTKNSDTTIRDRAKILRQIAETTNKGLPQQIDDIVRLDQVHSTDDSLEFYYTITKPELINITPSEFSEITKESLITNLRGDPRFEKISSLRANYIHTYKNLDVGFEARIILTPEIYGKVEQAAPRNR